MHSKILVVHADACERHRYRELFRPLAEVEVIEAEAGQHALQLARGTEFALYLLALSLPDISGFELASLMRMDPRSGATPMIFLSPPVEEPAALLRAYRMGAVDVVTEAPEHGELLLQKARVFVQLHQRQRVMRGSLEDLQQETQALRTRLEESGRQQQALLNQATHDALTRLPNRALFRDRLVAARARAGRTTGRCSRWPTSTWTASRRSTTGRATRRAMRCCRPWPTGW
jgi:PleD family two-component response regulator